MRGFDYRPIENWDIMYQGVGDYDIPAIDPIKLEREDVTEVHGFSEAGSLLRKKPELCGNIGLHFFLDDYRFIRLWRQPDKYIRTLTKFNWIMSPYFSTYWDMPFPVQLFSHYRKHWLARYYADFGVKIVPTIGWGDLSSHRWCFDGEPQDSTVAISTVGIGRDALAWKYFEMGFEEMVSRLNPYNVILYGRVPDWLKNEPRVINIRSYGQKMHDGR